MLLALAVMSSSNVKPSLYLGKSSAIFGAEYVLLNPFPQAELSGDALRSSALWLAFCLSELEDIKFSFIFIFFSQCRPGFQGPPNDKMTQASICVIGLHVCDCSNDHTGLAMS